MYRPKPTSLFHVLAFTREVSALIDARLPAEQEAPTETTAAAMYGRDAQATVTVQGAQRMLALYESLVTDGRALSMLPLLVEREDGREMTEDDAASVPSEVFVESWTLFLQHSNALTGGLLGLPSNTGSARSATPSPTRPTSSS